LPAPERDGSLCVRPGGGNEEPCASLYLHVDRRLCSNSCSVAAALERCADGSVSSRSEQA
jgi:hypothetical protein